MECANEVTECDDVQDIDYKFGEAEPFGETDTVIKVSKIRSKGTKDAPEFKSETPCLWLYFLRKWSG